jgi:hypothetical protein
MLTFHLCIGIQRTRIGVEGSSWKSRSRSKKFSVRSEFNKNTISNEKFFKKKISKKLYNNGYHRVKRVTSGGLLRSTNGNFFEAIRGYQE